MFSRESLVDNGLGDNHFPPTIHTDEKTSHLSLREALLFVIRVTGFGFGGQLGLEPESPYLGRHILVSYIHVDVLPGVRGCNKWERQK